MLEPVLNSCIRLALRDFPMPSITSYQSFKRMFLLTYYWKCPSTYHAIHSLSRLTHSPHRKSNKQTLFQILASLSDQLPPLHSIILLPTIPHSTLEMKFCEYCLKFLPARAQINLSTEETNIKFKAIIATHICILLSTTI